MKKVFLFCLIIMTSVVAQSYEYGDIYYAMTKAEEKAYRASDVVEAMNIFHNYMQPYVENIKESKRYKKLHRYGFLYSPLFDDCKNLDIEKKLELEKNIDSARIRFALEIAEFSNLLVEIDLESQHISDLETRIYELENEFNIQEKHHTKKKEEELNTLKHELELAENRKIHLESQLEPLRVVLAGIDEQLTQLREITSSIEKLNKWWKQEKEKLVKKRFLVAEYVLNNKYNAFIYDIEHTGKRISRVYYY